MGVPPDVALKPLVVVLVYVIVIIIILIIIFIILVAVVGALQTDDRARATMKCGKKYSIYYGLLVLCEEVGRDQEWLAYAARLMLQTYTDEGRKTIARLLNGGDYRFLAIKWSIEKSNRDR